MSQIFIKKIHILTNDGFSTERESNGVTNAFQLFHWNRMSRGGSPFLLEEERDTFLATEGC